MEMDSNYKQKSVDCVQILFMIKSDQTNDDKWEMIVNCPVISSVLLGNKPKWFPVEWKKREELGEQKIS